MADENDVITPADIPSDNYVQGLVDTAGDLNQDEVKAAPQAQPKSDAAKVETTPPEPATAPATEAVKVSDTADLDALIQQFAKETGLNPEDPGQAKTLKRLADKELHIQKLQKENETLKGTKEAATAGTPEFVTDFEKELMAADKVVPITDGTKPEPAKPAQAATSTGYGDVGDDWKTPEDSLTALNKAWTDNDMKAVHAVEVARLKRNFDALIAPNLISFIEQRVEARLRGFAEKDLGDVIPEVRRSAADKRTATSRDYAITQLRDAGASDIEDLFTAEDGPPIKFDGKDFPNTPLNRILTRHPEIMQIQAQHADPAKAEVKSFIARYKLAYQIYKQGKTATPAAVAEQIVEAGPTLKAKADKTRQALNAGNGASGVGVEKNTKSYIATLNSLPGEVSLSDLL